ncbi:hypothetical protein [Amaricoccus sp. W119]|uniref:hypothetical protein n=1 Tax=Amaricoccus sp. W119 TaxID=3391833 RepID=UPI0039A71E1A
MSAPVKTPPAPFEAMQLADTLDTMGLLVASLSDRIDAQGRMLEQVLKTATEARAAAFAAEKATDWKRNGDLINEGIARGHRQVQILATMAQGQREATDRVLRELRPLIATTTPRELESREKLERLRRWMPFMLAGMFVLGGVLARIASAFSW